MTDRTFKLDRLAMHQEWYDKNRPLLFLESSVVMQELLAMCRQYKAERDEARREVCSLQPFAHHNDGIAKDHAAYRGWDCFKENSDD